jgi:ribonuclease P protein component
VGNAVERNKIRRRLREILRLLSDAETRRDCDYVIVARREALTRTFAALKSDLARALAAVHRSDAQNRVRSASKPGSRPAPQHHDRSPQSLSPSARPSSTDPDDRPEE